MSPHQKLPAPPVYYPPAARKAFQAKTAPPAQAAAPRLHSKGIVQPMIGPLTGASRDYAKTQKIVVKKADGQRGKITYIGKNHLYRVEFDSHSENVAYDDPGYYLADSPPSAAAAPAPAPSSAALTERERLVADINASMFSSGPPRGVQAPVTVDPFAGLSPRVLPLARAISTWDQSRMAGFAAALDDREQVELRNWVEARRTGGGQQKYVVNIGPGTGDYADRQQFKVTGFRALGAKAATFHITLVSRLS